MITQTNSNIVNITEPSYLNFAYNPIWVKFNSYEYPSVSPIAPYINIEINVNPIENDFIIINGFKYVFKSNPTYGQVAIGATTIETAEDLYHVLNDDPRINYGYTIGRNSGTKYVFVKSKLIGDKYNINFTSSTAGIFLTINQTSSNANRGQNLNNYSIYLDVFKGDNFYFGQTVSDIYTPTYLTTVERDYQVDNEYVFDLSSILNKYLETDLPNFDNNQMYKVNGWFDNFSFKFGESYSSSAENKYKRKFEVGKGFDYWVSNASHNLFDNTSITEYYSNASVAECEIQFNTTYGSFNFIKFKSTTFNLLGAVSYAGLVASIADFVADFNASIHNTDYIATSIGTSVFITALTTGSAYNFNIQTNTSVIKIRDTSQTFYTQNITTKNGVDDQSTFLTNQPRIKTINRDNRFEILYFIYKMNNIINPLFYLRTTISYYDGITSTSDYYVTTADYGGLYAVNVNPANLLNNLDNINTDVLIKSIDVAIVYSYDGTVFNYLTDTMTYIINEDIEYRSERKPLFLFQNKLGVFDVATFNGQTTYTVKRENKTYKTAFTEDTSASDGIYKTLIASTIDTEVYNSGWINQETFIWLKELLNSIRVYKINQETGKYELINITDSTYEYNDKTELYNLTVTVLKTYNENSVAY